MTTHARTIDPDWLAVRDRVRDFVARRVAASADVDDVLQDALLRVHRALPSLADEERFGALVHRAAKSAVIDFYRRRSTRTSALERAAHEPRVDVVEPLDVMDATGASRFARDLEQELARCMRPVVDTLDEPYRAALVAVELERKTQVEAAREAGVAVSTMKSRVQRGRVKLREALESCCTFALDARNRVVDLTPKGERCVCGCA